MATERRGLAEQNAAPRVHARDDRGREENLRGTETKAAFKTTELIVYLVASALVLIAGYIVDGFNATETWRYFTYLSIGYMISRGLAKDGSRNPKAEGE